VGYVTQNASGAFVYPSGLGCGFYLGLQADAGYAYYPYGGPTNVYFESTDCSGQGFVGVGSPSLGCMTAGPTVWRFVQPISVVPSVTVQSYLLTDGTCALYGSITVTNLGKVEQVSPPPPPAVPITLVPPG
jgi:hypothetical protein